MTSSEFSNQFDVLYNNIMSNQAPGLDDYEKSVFLTKAQNEIVLAYFNPKGNKFFEGFDSNERRQVDFSMITVVYTVDKESTPSFRDAIFDGRTAGIKSVEFPTDALLIINERLDVTRGTSNLSLTVIPVSYTEYTRLMSKPFKRPNHYQAWRIINTDENSSTRLAELIAGPSDDLVKYVARYIKRPQPIIVGDLEGVTIEGRDSITECELDPIIHEDILQRAVELAKAAYTGDLSSQIGVGVNSATEKGLVPQSNSR